MLPLKIAKLPWNYLNLLIQASELDLQVLELDVETLENALERLDQLRYEHEGSPLSTHC